MRSNPLLPAALVPVLLAAASPAVVAKPVLHDFSVETLDGRILDSRELRGRVLLIDVWATWCGPCRAAAPALDRLYSDLGGRGLEMLGVAVQSGPPEEVARAAREMGMNYPIVLWSEEIARSLGEIRSVPTYVVVAPDGTVAATFVGATSPRVLRKQVEELLPPAADRDAGEAGSQ